MSRGLRTLHGPELRSGPCDERKLKLTFSLKTRKRWRFESSPRHHLPGWPNMAEAAAINLRLSLQLQYRRRLPDRPSTDEHR